MRGPAGLILAVAVAAGCAATGPAPAFLEDLVDVRWYWIAGIADGNVRDRPDAARHWFETGPGGAVIVQADCNAGVGRRPNPDGFAFGPIGLTRRSCGDDRQDTTFATLLSGVTDASVDAGLLRLHSGAVVLLFSRDPRATLKRYRCAGRALDIAWGERTAWIVGATRSDALDRAEPRDPPRFVGARSILAPEGETLLLEDRAAGTRERCDADGT